LAAETKTISIVGCCRHLGISKQAYYKVRKNRDEQKEKEARVIRKVMNVRQEQPRIGTRKLHFMLKSDLGIGRDKLFEILRKEQLLIRKRKKYVKTTNSKHWMRTYADSSKQIQLKQPEQLWVADITYLSTREDAIYLHLVSDAYSKQIMGYTVSKDLKAESTVKALQMALQGRVYRSSDLLHHSDRGLQYCSKLYIDELLGNNCKISMTEDGSPYDNAVAERINGILKDEFYCDEKFDSFEQAKKHVKQSIMIYNTKRPHLSCSMLTPKEMHQQNTLQVKKWNKKTSLLRREVH
jgi:transposase InsO family protein